MREENPRSPCDPSRSQGFFSASETEAGPLRTDRLSEHDIQRLISTFGGSAITSAGPNKRDAEDIGGAYSCTREEVLLWSQRR